MVNLFPVHEYIGQAMFFPTPQDRKNLLKDVWQKKLLMMQVENLSLQKSQNQQIQFQFLKMLQAIHDIYARSETFLDFLAHDLDDDIAWFSNSEFARYHDIDGHKILSILTSDTRTQAINVNLADHDDPVGLKKSRGVLFCRAQEIEGVFAAEQSLRLDGRLYIIAEANLIQEQIWRIVLEANN